MTGWNVIRHKTRHGVHYREAVVTIFGPRELVDELIDWALQFAQEDEWTSILLEEMSLADLQAHAVLYPKADEELIVLVPRTEVLA
jgi:hypothetical protein